MQVPSPRWCRHYQLHFCSTRPHPLLTEAGQGRRETRERPKVTQWDFLPECAFAPESPTVLYPHPSLALAFDLCELELRRGSTWGVGATTFHFLMFVHSKVSESRVGELAPGLKEPLARQPLANPLLPEGCSSSPAGGGIWLVACCLLHMACCISAG